MSDMLTNAGETTDTTAPANEAAESTATDTTVTDQQQQTTETDTDTSQEGEGEQQTEKSGAPDKYEFQAPEGQTFDNAVLDAYSEVARELNLSQDDAQKLLDKVAPVMQARQQEQIEAVRNEWSELSKTDKEFGGENLNANLAVAKKALDAFASPELKTLLNEAGLGNHPEIIRFMYRAGKNISEDRIVTGQQPTGSDKSLADKLYSNQK